MLEQKCRAIIHEAQEIPFGALINAGTLLESGQLFIEAHVHRVLFDFDDGTVHTIAFRFDGAGWPIAESIVAILLFCLPQRHRHHPEALVLSGRALQFLVYLQNIIAQSAQKQN